MATNRCVKSSPFARPRLLDEDSIVAIRAVFLMSTMAVMVRRMIPAAYLRVYFPEAEAASWPAHVTGPTRSVISASEQFVWGETGADDAFVAEWEGKRWVCPRRPRLRMLEGALAFSNANPGSLLLSEPTVQELVDELESLRSMAPDARSQILTSPWHVPLRWFSLFRSEEREMYNSPDGHSVRYRTPAGKAVPRVKRAVAILETAGFDDAIIDQVRELEQWLERFDAGSLVELDYGRVAGLFSGADLALDDSAELINASLSALYELDYERAGSAYGMVAERWAKAQALSYVN